MRPLHQLFHRILGLQGCYVTGVSVDESQDLEISVRLHGNVRPHCPTCGRTMAATGKRVPIRWRHLDILAACCFLKTEVQVGRCATHGERQESVPWAETRAHHTKAFDRQVASLVQVADRSAAARMFGVCWRTVETMVRRVVAELLPTDLLEGLIAIAIDETSYKRGHRYLTIVTDLVERRVVWIGEGRSAETLRAFFDELGHDRARKLEAITMDMSGSYKTVVAERAPQADVIFDRFHVVKLLLEAIDEVRRQECARLEGRARSYLKGMRFQLLGNPRYKRPHQLWRIRQTVQINRRLAAAYERRVSFEDLWDCTDVDEARAFVARWTRSALQSRLEPLRKFARTVRAHLDGILNFIRYEGLTNAIAEGINNKIKLQIHKAYGFQTVEGLVAMIQLCCSGISFSPRIAS